MLSSTFFHWQKRVNLSLEEKSKMSTCDVSYHPPLKKNKRKRNKNKTHLVWLPLNELLEDVSSQAVTDLHDVWLKTHTHTHSLQQMCGQKCFAGVCELFSWVGRTACSHTVSEPQPCLPGLYLWANLFHRNSHWTFTSCLWLKESLSCLCSCNTEVLYYCCTYNPRTEKI